MYLIIHISIYISVQPLKYRDSAARGRDLQARLHWGPLRARPRPTQGDIYIYIYIYMSIHIYIYIYVYIYIYAYTHM